VTVAVSPGDTAPGSAGPRRALAQTRELARRSLLAEWRNPFGAASGLIFPLMLAAVYSAQFERATALPGFPPVDSFLDFILPASILQAVAFGATAAGGEMALDIQNGFFDRLLAAPTSRVSILLGKLAGVSVVAALKAVVLLAVFLAFGASVKGGVAAALVLVAVAVLLVLFLGGLGLMLAIRTGSQEAVDSTFPLIFVTLFVSSAFFPTALMEGWYRSLAEANPITWMIDPARRLVISGFSWSDALTAMAVPAVGAVLTIGLALVALRRRLAAS
jgi:ABC-2 type transport system permease protein